MHQPSQNRDPADDTALPSAAALRERDERLAALKQLVGHLAHDFNNCMVPLVGYVTLLKEEPKIGTRVDLYLAKLESSVRKTETFLETILEATHPERHFCPKEVDFCALIQTVVDGCVPSTAPMQPVTLSLELSPCVLWLDEAQWIKCIQHLVRNAQLALAKTGGTLRLKLEHLSLSESEAEELSLRPGATVQLTVEDTGQGMNEDVLKRAYDPFFSTRSDTRTEGLGLTFVHSVVRLHGGQLAIASAEGAGTRVRIWLPNDRR
jgi:signal transduction histidine kinase